MFIVNDMAKIISPAVHLDCLRSKHFSFSTPITATTTDTRDLLQSVGERGDTTDPSHIRLPRTRV